MYISTIFPHVRPTFLLHKSVPGAGIIRNVGTIQGRALYEEIRYVRCVKNLSVRIEGFV